MPGRCGRCARGWQHDPHPGRHRRRRSPRLRRTEARGTWTSWVEAISGDGGGQEQCSRRSCPCSERREIDSPTRLPYAHVVPSAPDQRSDRVQHRLPPLKLIVIIWLIPALLSGFDTYMQSRLNGNPPPWRWVAFNSIDWLLYA